MIFPFTAMIAYGTIVVFHHFNQLLWAKVYYSIVIPLWCTVAMILVNGNFGQSLMSASTIIITYFLLKEKVRLRNNLIIFNAILYISATLLMLYTDPILGERDYPLDEVVVWGLAITWLSIVFSIHEEKTNLFIKSLQEKNEQLEQKTNELERFTYIASHDLKSPLRNIISFLSLIKRGIEKEKYDNLLHYLSFAETGAHQMNELIEGVLEISKIDQFNETNYKLVDLNIVLEKVIVNLQNELTKVEIYSDKLPSILCKESEFIIIFQNLLQNAIKYNVSQVPTIMISSNSKEDMHFIQFTDNGIGIEEKYYDQIFEFFKRLHTSEKYPGTGLGLGLCKKIITNYNGSISVKSELNKYTTFTIGFPITQNIEEHSNTTLQEVSSDI